MAKPNFKPQRPARKVKLKADKQNVHKVNKKVAIKKKSGTKIKTKTNQWQLPSNYFDNLPPTHNTFIGELGIDTLDNVLAGIQVIKELTTQEQQGVTLNLDTCQGLYWLSQNLIQALRFERDYRQGI